MRPSKVFTIAPGSPFLKTFVTALKDGKIIDGFTIADPFALAKTTIYVPTRRAARALADELANSLIFSSPGSGAAVPSAMLLPRIKPFGGIEKRPKHRCCSTEPRSTIPRRRIPCSRICRWRRAKEDKRPRFFHSGLWFNIRS